MNRSQILTAIWDSLETAVRQWHHPFRTPVLGSVSLDGQSSQLRTVVLREVDRTTRELICHTDFRSVKVRELRSNPRSQWLFYNAKERVQLRISGRIRLHHRDATTRQAWSQTPLPNRRDYCTEKPPGTPIEKPDRAGPTRLTVEESERGLENFTVIRCRIKSMDYLKLGVNGHRRARFQWINNRLSSTWLVP